MVKNDEMVKNDTQIFQNLSSEFKPTVEMSESSILLKPNFKIKHYLTKSKSKMDPMINSRINKSMDFDRKLSKANELKGFLQSISQKVSSNEKSVLKWQPRRKSTVSGKLIALSPFKDNAKRNPEE